MNIYWEKSPVKKNIFILDLLLELSSFIFLFFYCLRVLIYKYGIKRKKRLKAKVISVGNLTLGGSGKTPMVVYLASEFKKKGKKVVILTRGYKRKAREQKELQGKTENLSWDLFGDEPFLLASNLPDVPVIINKSRFEAGSFAQKKYEPDLLILDDGFQHWGLERDLDLVMIDSTFPISKEKLFPKGRLREPLSALKRADLVVLNQKGESTGMKDTVDFVIKYNPSCFLGQSSYEVSEVENIADGKSIDFSALRGEKTIAFSGIADNLSFERTLLHLGMGVLEHIKFSDHHIYSEKDMMNIQDEGKRKGASFLCTTEKDSIRLPKTVDFQLPVYVAKIKLRIKDKEKDFWDFIEEKLRW